MKYLRNVKFKMKRAMQFDRTLNTLPRTPPRTINHLTNAQFNSTVYFQESLLHWGDDDTSYRN